MEGLPSARRPRRAFVIVAICAAATVTGPARLCAEVVLTETSPGMRSSYMVESSIEGYDDYETPRARPILSRLSLALKGTRNTRNNSPALEQGYSLVLGREGAVLSLTSGAGKLPLRFQDKPLEAKSFRSAVFGIKLLGSNPTPDLSSAGDAQPQRAGGAQISNVRFEQVYPGIDWVWHGSPQQLEYDFVIEPGADPHRIRFAFEGVRETEIDRKGDLVLRFEDGELRQARPNVYQVSGGKRRPVEGRYAIFGSHGIGFKLGEYDKKLQLVID